MRSLTLFISCLFFLPMVLFAHEAESIKVVVVGDTGIGERAFHPGFDAVQNAMRKEQADAILHLGDFVYLPWGISPSCPGRYIKKIKETLVEPYLIKIFVAGDNDLPGETDCWKKIKPMATPFDRPAVQGPKPGTRAGVMHLETALFVVLDVYEWQDPAPWLKPLTDAARRKGLWIVFALHEPALTTAWYKEKRQTVLKQINALRPDLVLAGNQHSYERFYPMGIPQEDGSLPVLKKSKYKKGAGVTHVVAGGGGAKFKPFGGRPVPDTVTNARAKKALMFHYLTLKISHDVLKAKTWRVCPPKQPPDAKPDPRWKFDKKPEMWRNVVLECDDKEAGVTVYDQFEIVR